MESAIKGRLGKIFENAKDVDALFIYNASYADPNFFYLTQLRGGTFEDDIVVATRNYVYIILSPKEFESAKSRENQDMLVISNERNEKVVKKWMNKLVKGKTIGINASFLTTNACKKLIEEYNPKKVTDVSDAFEQARLVKDRHEIEEIKKAVEITKLAMLAIQEHFKEGVSEKELAAKFDYLSATMGSEGLPFSTIVAFGKNAAYPHHASDDTKLKEGDFIIIDAGAKVNGYCSDLTRTFIFSKNPDKKKMDVYNAVKEAQKRGFKAIRSGVRGGEVHNAAEKYINNVQHGKYRGKFIHGLGHSMGILDHDGSPGLSKGSKLILKPGMVMSVEPGIYIKGFGGVRIEDDVVVTEEGDIIL